MIAGEQVQRVERPVREANAAIGVGDLPAEIAGPVLAGMRARSTADLCERLGLAAFLIGRDGFVLHATPAAADHLGAGIDLVADHLIAGDDEANRALGSLLTDVLAATASTDVDRGRIPASLPGCSTVIFALRYDDRSPFQFLKAVIVLARGSDDCKAAVAVLASSLAE